MDCMAATLGGLFGFGSMKLESTLASVSEKYILGLIWCNVFPSHTHSGKKNSMQMFYNFFIISEKNMFLLQYNDLELCFLLNITKHNYLCFFRGNIQELY